ncbi:hypothetical protein ACIQYF_17760 [Pseudomonas sp. NPDC096917]
MSFDRGEVAAIAKFTTINPTNQGHQHRFRFFVERKAGLSSGV